MQVTPTLNEGLKRQFKVNVPAADLMTRYEEGVQKLLPKVNLQGFRPGKVPASHVKRLYGQQVMVEVIQGVVDDANKKIADEAKARLAAEPKVEFGDQQFELQKFLNGGVDLDFTVDLELLPKVEIKDHTGVSLVREIAEVLDKDIDGAIENMASSNRAFAPRDEKEKAKDGDKVTIDFVGTLEGVAFEGGTGGDVDLVLGSGQFIPGFEEQLVGAKVGDNKTVKVTFPAEYQAAHLAGKAAEFAVTVKAVQAPGELKIDDDLAKKFGLDNVEKLREAVKESLGEELKEQSRLKIKRRLLDALDAIYDFELPPSLLQAEFDLVWRQLTDDMKRAGQSFSGTEEEEARKEYGDIAARRVRLGLVLTEIGEKAAVKVEEAEVTQALVLRARQFPGQEKQVFEYYRKNPQALADIRAPLFEEKVVDHLISTVSVTEKTVTRDQLFADDEEAKPVKTANALKQKAGA